MQSYESTRTSYRPDHVKLLFVAESPPPAAGVASSRQFYRTDRVYPEDRLFANTIKALYPDATDQTEPQLKANKESWLRRFQRDGYYMIEALDESQPHEATKQQRQERIRAHLPQLIAKVKTIARPDTRLILIKSNVYDVAAEPLSQAGFDVLNTGIVDYPGRFNQRTYRDKVARLLTQTL